MFKMSSFCLFLTLAFINFLVENVSTENHYTTKAFIEMVKNNITACENYILPVNNEKLFYVLPSQEEIIYDFGTFDFIIVGAGAAGTLLANRLTEINEWNVLLLEAGGQENDFSDIPGMTNYLASSDMNWGYLTVPQKRACKTMNGNQCVATRGKVVGGSSTINSKQYVRGNKADYDAWAKMGNPGWSYKDVLPYFIKTENCGLSNCDPKYRGKGGMLNINYTEPTIFTPVMLNGMRELGYSVLDFNGKQQIGVSRVQFTIKGNKIASGGRSFIDPFLNRKNLNVTTNAFVTQLIFDRENKTAIGVQFTKNGKKYQVRAKKEVVLSAGAINSPQILMTSGIGPKEELSKIGVDIILDLPVGKNMEDHVAFTGLNFRTNLTLFNESIDTMLKKYLKNHRPLTAAVNADVVTFINVNGKNSSVPNIQQIAVAPPGISALQKNVINLKKLKSLAKPYNDLNILIVLLHPKSKGSVTLKSKSSLDFPNIDTNYYAKEDDTKTMLKAIKETLKLLDTKAFKSVNASYAPSVEICTDLNQGSDEYWQCMIEQLSTTLYHFVGTTRMGSSKINSVVNSKLLVHGIAGLRVVDAGVIPKISSGNTVAPTYMIAEKAADLIKTHHLSHR